MTTTLGRRNFSGILFTLFCRTPPSRAPLRMAVGTCHGAPRVAPWYALLVSVTLGLIDRGAPITLAPTRALDTGCWPTSSVDASVTLDWCVHSVLDPAAARPAACCRS